LETKTEKNKLIITDNMAMVSLCIILKLLKSNLLTPKKEHLSNKYKRTYIYIYIEKIKNKWEKKIFVKKNHKKRKKIGKKTKKKKHYINPQ
jgi:uncharacterized membrane protein